ncbi:hypothetical protein EVAR_5449_1 [Eumeta japonica]|uniref:Protein kinase domain-containing protein n=1 Tax=Eumeta variegata TaxID=151549 RepID=A0A4C1TBP3_EUMVA|nr:hypothetical protein EVAR_5449_1 [Eumeta japonica]
MQFLRNICGVSLKDRCKNSDLRKQCGLKEDIVTRVEKDLTCVYLNVKMSNYDDEQSEDGELARSPTQDEMDFSLSDEDRDPDSLVIKPPQAVIRPSHRERKAHKRSGKDRHRDTSRKEKKHVYRDRDKPDKNKRDLGKNVDREEIGKDIYRKKPYYRDEDEYRENDVREKDVYRDINKEREIYREKETYRDRDRDHYREMYRQSVTYRSREISRQKDSCREKAIYKDRDVQREREMHVSRDRQVRYVEVERKQRLEPDRIESKLRLIAEDSHSLNYSEKENRSRSSGDKELEDLRSRLISNRMSKEFQSQESKRQPEYYNQESKRQSDKNNSKPDRSSNLDKHHQERRRKLVEAEREIEKRKYEARSELEARREERRKRGKKRSVSPQEETLNKKNKTEQSPTFVEAIVTVSDASDVEIKSESPQSEQEEGEHSQSETEDESSVTNSESDDNSKSEEEDEKEGDEKSDKEESDTEKKMETEEEVDKKEKSQSPSNKSKSRSPASNESKRSHSRSRSRSHSFSPPPPGENGKSGTEDERNKDDEERKIDEEKINSLPPYYPALQGCRSVEEFQCLNRIEEGTYGVVYRARDKTTEEIVALKRLKMEKEKEGFPITSLREINTLLKVEDHICFDMY